MCDRLVLVSVQAPRYYTVAAPFTTDARPSCRPDGWWPAVLFGAVVLGLALAIELAFAMDARLHGTWAVSAQATRSVAHSGSGGPHFNNARSPDAPHGHSQGAFLRRGSSGEDGLPLPTSRPRRPVPSPLRPLSSFPNSPPSHGMSHVEVRPPSWHAVPALAMVALVPLSMALVAIYRNCNMRRAPLSTPPRLAMAGAMSVWGTRAVDKGGGMIEGSVGSEEGIDDGLAAPSQGKALTQICAVTEYLRIPGANQEGRPSRWNRARRFLFGRRKKARRMLTKCTAVPRSKTMELPLGRYIPVSLNTLNASITNHLPADDARIWRDISFHLESVVSTYYNEEARDAKASLEELELGKEWNPKAEALLYEQIVTLLNMSCHRPLTQFWYDFTHAADFTFSVPMIPDWRRTGSEELQAFLERGTIYPEDRIPLFAFNVLIFVRGPSVQEKTGWFWLRKFRHLIEEWLYNNFLSRRKSVVPPYGPTCEMVQTLKVRRQTIASLYEELGLFRWLFSKLTLAEPAFESVKICYRQQKAGKPQMVLESFRQIALADMEGILPVAKIYLRPLSRLWFVIRLLLLGAFIFGIWRTLFHTKRALGFEAFLTPILFEAVRRFYMLISGYRNKMRGYELDRVTWKENKKSGEGRVVISDICDEVTNEETKQILLMYFLLWQHGAQTSKQLLKRAEGFLKQEFDVEANIDVEDAVDKLVRLGFAREVAHTGAEGGCAKKVTVAGSPQQILSRFSDVHRRLFDSFREVSDGELVVQNAESAPPPP